MKLTTEQIEQFIEARQQLENACVLALAVLRKLPPKSGDTIGAAMKDLQRRTRCSEWVLRIRDGKGQLVRIHSEDGQSITWILSDWLPVAELPAFIRAIPAK